MILTDEKAFYETLRLFPGGELPTTEAASRRPPPSTIQSLHPPTPHPPLPHPLSLLKPPSSACRTQTPSNLQNSLEPLCANNVTVHNVHPPKHPPLGRLLQISQVQPGFRQVRPIFRGKSFHLLKVQQRSNECCCNNCCYGRALVTHLSLFILHTYSLLMHTYLLL